MGDADESIGQIETNNNKRLLAPSATLLTLKINIDRWPI